MDSLVRGLNLVDTELTNLIKAEKKRQFESIELIASENFTSLAVNEALGSCLTNKYSEGYPGQRYYGGTDVIDEIEELCIFRALAVFHLNSTEWGVNVQPYSGSPANFAVYTALVGPHGRIMGLDLPDGGHLTHGFASATKKVSATSLFFESMPYKVDTVTGIIDYDALEKQAILFRPKLIIAGISCYPRALDYGRFREIADRCGSLLMADMAHVSGLVAAKIAPSPFEHCDVVTTTTHKTLRGPRSGMIFFRKGVKSTGKDGKSVMWDLERKINEAVFPGLQGGPHNHQIAAVAVTLLLAMQQDFVEYQVQVVMNAQKMCAFFIRMGYTVVTGGTDSHIVLLDLSRSGVRGNRVERVLELMNIAVNKNTVPGDKSPLNPSGIRIGTAAITSRGMKVEDIDRIVQFIHEGIQLSLEVQASGGGPKFADFIAVLEEAKFEQKLSNHRAEVFKFATKFEMPGHRIL